MTQLQYSMQPHPNLCAAPWSWMKLLFCKMSCADADVATRSRMKVAAPVHAGHIATFFLRLHCEFVIQSFVRSRHTQYDLYGTL